MAQPEADTAAATTETVDQIQDKVEVANGSVAAADGGAKPGAVGAVASEDAAEPSAAEDAADGSDTDADVPEEDGAAVSESPTEAAGKAPAANGDGAPADAVAEVVADAPGAPKAQDVNESSKSEEVVKAEESSAQEAVVDEEPADEKPAAAEPSDPADHGSSEVTDALAGPGAAAPVTEPNSVSEAEGRASSSGVGGGATLANGLDAFGVAAPGTVQELTRRLSQGSLSIPSTPTRPGLADKSMGSIGARAGAAKSPAGEASPPPSAHDSKNTINVSQLIKMGAFSKQPLQDFVPYEELQRLRLEDGIDATRKEDYLSDDEFKTVFGIDRDTFKKQPAWRQVQAKKAKNLF